MGSACKRLLLIALLLISSVSARAQVAEFHDGVLTVPEVITGGIAYRIEFSLLPDSDPMSFELIASSSTELTGSLLAATFDEGVLKIPEAHFDGSSYWLELNNNGNNLFTVSAWGENPPLPPVFTPPGNPSLDPSLDPLPDLGTGYRQPIWQRLHGFAYDIGVGANGAVWVVGTDPQPGGFGIYNLNNSGGFPVQGGALRIDVDPNGNPWIINYEHKIYRWVDGFWQQMPGEALDVGIGADGSVWVASYEGIYLWSGRDWINFGGQGSRIDVGPDGTPWVVGFSDRIFTLVDGFWRELPGFAGDIGVGADGSVWVVAPAEFTFDGFEEPRGVFRWHGTGWYRVFGDAIDLSVGPDGMPWVTNFFAEIYRGY